MQPPQIAVALHSCRHTQTFALRHNAEQVQIARGTFLESTDTQVRRSIRPNASFAFKAR
jgi:hypothetical protein